MTLAIVDEYKIVTGVFSGRPNWMSTLKFACPCCNASLKAVFQGPNDSEYCPVCGGAFLISDKKLQNAIEAYETNTGAERRQRDEPLRAQKKGNKEQKTPEILAAEIAKGKKEKEDVNFMLGCGCLTIVVTVVALVLNQFWFNFGMSPVASSRPSEASSIESRIGSLTGSDWHRLSDGEKQSVCNELSRRLIGKHPFATSSFIREGLDTFFKDGFGASEKVTDILAAIVVVGDAN